MVTEKEIYDQALALLLREQRGSKEDRQNLEEDYFSLIGQSISNRIAIDQRVFHFLDEFPQRRMDLKYAKSQWVYIAEILEDLISGTPSPFPY